MTSDSCQPPIPDSRFPIPGSPAEGIRLRSVLIVCSVVVLALGVHFALGEWSAADHFQKGKQAAEERRFADALKEFETSRRAWPSDPEVAFLTARTARRSGEITLADEELDRAERLGWNPEAIALEKTLSKAQRGQFRAAEESLVRAVRQSHPDALYIVEVLGPAYARTFTTGLAREMLEKWVELAPTDAAPHFWIGEVSARRHDSITTRREFEKALELDPNHREAAVKLAMQSLDEKRFDQALGYLEPLLAKSPTDRELRLLVAQSCQDRESQGRAQVLLESLLAEFPDDAKVLLERGRLAMRADQPEEAIQWLTRAFEKAPFESLVSFNLANALQAVGKPEEAKKFRERFRRIEADQQLLSELNKKIQIDSRNADLRVDFALVLMRNEQWLAAADWLATALELNPRSDRANRELATVYDKLGKPDLARRHRELAGPEPK